MIFFFFEIKNSKSVESLVIIVEAKMPIIVPLRNSIIWLVAIFIVKINIFSAMFWWFLPF